MTLVFGHLIGAEPFFVVSSEKQKRKFERKSVQETAYASGGHLEGEGVRDCPPPLAEQRAFVRIHFN